MYLSKVKSKFLKIVTSRDYYEDYNYINDNSVICGNVHSTLEFFGLCSMPHTKFRHEVTIVNIFIKSRTRKGKVSRRWLYGHSKL